MADLSAWIGEGDRRVTVRGTAGESPIAAIYALEILTPRSDLHSKSRVFHAYPGLDYNIRAAVIGGMYPYSYSLSNAPAGMSIVASTGAITWTNPQTTASDIVLTVTDQWGSTAQQTWSVAVATTYFKFVDDSAADDTGTGTLADPWKTLAKVSTDSAATDIVYFRTGTYTSDDLVNHGSWGGTAPYHSWTVTRASQFLAYPGESPIWDYGYVEGVDAGQFIQFQAGSNCCYFDGLEVRNFHTIAFYLEPRSVVRRCAIHNLAVGGDGTNAAHIDFPAATMTTYSVVQDCELYDGIGYSCVIKGYTKEKLLVEDNAIHDVYGGLEMKAGMPRYTLRGNTIANVTARDAIGESMNVHDGVNCSGEICFNNVSVATTGTSDVHNALHLNTFGVAERTDVYRNTLVGWVFLRSVEDVTDGPFVLSRNVIVNPESVESPWPHIVDYLVTETSRVTVTENLVGVAADGLVDANGDLAGANASYLGSRGYQVAP